MGGTRDWGGGSPVAEDTGYDEPRIFISYRRDDTKHLAGRLADTLSTYSPVFMDLDAIARARISPNRSLTP